MNRASRKEVVSLVLLTIIRRVLIMVVACAIVVDSVFLLMAHNAREAKAGNQGKDAFKIEARVDTKEAAEALAQKIKLDKADLSPQVTVQSVTRARFVETGKWRVESKFSKSTASGAESFKRALGVPATIEENEDGQKTVCLGESFKTQADAERQAAALLRKGLGMQVVKDTQKKMGPAFVLVINVSDHEALEAMKDFLTGKATVESPAQ